MLIRRPLAMACMLLALVCTGQTYGAEQSQVLDLVPSNAMVVLKFKSLDQLNTKVAKAAKQLGLDQMAPEFSDPLGALQQQSHMEKGLNKAGDMAVIFVNPDAAGGPDKSVVALVPTGDYKAFVGNFKDPSVTGDITKVKSPDGDEELYIAHWGEYAAVSPSEALIQKKPAGIKLSAALSKETAGKDVAVYINMPAVKAQALPKLKESHDQIMKEIESGLTGTGEMDKKFLPVIKAVVNQYLAGAERFMEDSSGVVIGMNLTDAGLLTSAVADFIPDSKMAKIAGLVKNTDQPLALGLPTGHKYFLLGGTTASPALSNQLFTDVVEPIVKELQQMPEAKGFVAWADAAKKVYSALSGTSFGLVAPTAPLGQESVIQEVLVARGDAKAIMQGNRDARTALSDFMKSLPQQNGSSITSTYTPGAKTVDGVKLDEFETKINMNADDPQQAQAQQMLATLFGANGMKGVMGEVNAKSVIIVSGGSDLLVSDAITAAKDKTDTTAKMPALQSVTAELPKTRAVAAYLELGNVVTTAVNYAKGLGLPINAKLPADLPPIGMTLSSDRSSMRSDVFIPMDLVKGLVTFGMEAQQQASKPDSGV